MYDSDILKQKLWRHLSAIVQKQYEYELKYPDYYPSAQELTQEHLRILDVNFVKQSMTDMKIVEDYANLNHELKREKIRKHKLGHKLLDVNPTEWKKKIKLETKL